MCLKLFQMAIYLFHESKYNIFASKIQITSIIADFIDIIKNTKYGKCNNS